MIVHKSQLTEEIERLFHEAKQCGLSNEEIIEAVDQAARPHYEHMDYMEQFMFAGWRRNQLEGAEISDFH